MVTSKDGIEPKIAKRKSIDNWANENRRRLTMCMNSIGGKSHSAEEISQEANLKRIGAKFKGIDQDCSELKLRLKFCLAEAEEEAVPRIPDRSSYALIARVMSESDDAINKLKSEAILQLTNYLEGKQS